MNASRPFAFSHGTIVLAAGASRRLGHAKQLVERDGETLLHRAARIALATAPVETLVVLGHDADRMHAAIRDLPVKRVDCADWAEGMAASLRCGLAALSRHCTHALVVLCDQLLLDAAHLQALVRQARAAPDRAVASAYAGVRGVPAVFPRPWFPALMSLRGDTGARDLLRMAVEAVAIDAPGLALDLDQP